MTPEEELIQLRQEKIIWQAEKTALQEENAELKAKLAGVSETLTRATHRLEALEERQAKDSHNSHLPPSSDRLHRQPESLRRKSGKQPGGQSDHPGRTLMLSPSPDLVLVHPIEHCQHCHQDLRKVVSQQVERRQVIDLPPKRVVVIEHQAQQKCCPACQQISTAAFPDNVRAPVQYGAAFGAVGVYLVQQQLLPYERACEVMQDLLGSPMCVGTLQTLVQRCAEQLEPVEQQIKATLVRADVLHQDETGLYVAGQRQWIHVSATEQLTHYALHSKRGKEALEAIGILKDFQGVSVHDGWRSYWQYACQHALCNVHHLRELIFLAEGYQANPPDPPPEGGKKGRRKQSAARNLLDRLSKNQDAVLAFMDNFAVPFDNSLAERDLWMVKVQQKVSGCFRSRLGAQAFCRIRGYLSSLRKQGMSLLIALEQALVGHPISPAL